VVVGLVASALMPPPPPTPSRAAPGPSGSSASAGAKAPPTTLNAHVGVMINLPMAISIPARDQTPDDGTSMFLTGPGGGFTMDPGTGTVQTVYSGTAFAKDMRRAVILSGLWVSSWPASATTCGPTCWPAADTYRIDPATGGVTKSLPATYLLGAASDGIWVAADGQIERLDASTGEVLSTTPWRGSGEPRIGCGLLWAFTPGDKGAALTELDPESGNVIGQSSLGPGVAYGPAFVEGQCWMMSGSEGASGGSTTLVWLKPNGTTVSQFDYPGKSVVTLDGEFWLYSTTRVLQRFEATSGVVYGVPYVLPVRPPGDDPKWLFSASRTVWMIDGTKLSGFDVPTGTSRVNG
jgi:hypothetical protein